jgi:hypothetical protein
MRSLRRRLILAAFVLALLVLAGAGALVGAVTPKGQLQ